MYIYGLNEFMTINLHIAHFSLIVEQKIPPEKEKKYINRWTIYIYSTQLSIRSILIIKKIKFEKKKIWKKLKIQ